jgi:hypothetical protein
MRQLNAHFSTKLPHLDDKVADRLHTLRASDEFVAYVARLRSADQLACILRLEAFQDHLSHRREFIRSERRMERTFDASPDLRPIHRASGVFYFFATVTLVQAMRLLWECLSS